MPPHNSRYRVPLRRRREQKTDYQARKGFVVSGKPRLVSRSSLKNTIAQIIVAKPKGDEVLASAHSKELVNKYGWKAATGNISAAYLTGLLCGLKAKKSGVSEAILDLGLVSPTKGSKVFATMSGVVDAGIEIPHSKEKIVEERIRGEHIQEYAEILKSAEEESAPKFSTYKSKGLAPEQFRMHFDQVRNRVLKAFDMPVPEEAEAPKIVKTEKAAAPPAKSAKAEKVDMPPKKMKAEVKVEEKPKGKTKPKPKAKAETKKSATAKVKAEKSETKAKSKTAKKASSSAKKAVKKPDKKTGDKKA